MPKKMDSQQIEIIGRNLLITDLLRSGVEVARPERDRGVDLIAYLDKDSTFMAVPMQLKATSGEAFSVSKKYGSFPDMLSVYVWNALEIAEPEIYALTHLESVAVADGLGWTRTASWREKGHYVTTKPSGKVRTQLEPFRVGPGRWVDRLWSAATLRPTLR